LDLSSAFDTINHSKLITILKEIGLGGSVLDWFESYLKDRGQSIVCRDSVSSCFEMDTGVPQGSVLGPILFNIYTTSLGKVLARFGMSYHFYADDTQMYLSFKPGNEVTAISTIQQCLQTIRDWMISHHLKMNDGKTEAMLFGTKNIISRLKNISVTIGDLEIIPNASCKSLGVTFDSSLSMGQQVNNQCRNAFIHLRSLARVKQFLTPDCLETLVHAFITSKLDYANSLYLGAPKSVINKLQCVQNSAARLITGKKKYDHISPILYDLHWLPVQQRIKFKVLLIMFKAKHSLLPSYLTELFSSYVPSRSLRSSDGDLYHIPFTRSSFIRESTIQHAGPRMWNALPIDIKKSESVSIFKSRLKTELFREFFSNI
jgi:hypothetical protein